MVEIKKINDMQKEIEEQLSPYFGRTVQELKEGMGVVTNNKASFVTLSRKMLGITTNKILLSSNQEVIIKTVRMTGGSNPAEAMSFLPVDFDEWIDANSWEESKLYKYFKKNYFVFFIYAQYPSGKRVEDNEMIFKSIKVWKINEYDLNHGIKEVWEEVRNLINNNTLSIVQKKLKNGRIVNQNNLPSSKFNGIAHLRPGAVNGNDKVLLPNGQLIVKQKFWLNINYIKEMLNE